MRPGPILTFALLAAAGAVGWYWLNDPASPQAPPNRQQGRRAAYREGPVPVTAEPVRTDTVPVFREGIGNVQALYTVTVHSQIDGRLTSVDFTEGEMVRKGAVLARLDPVVYQAQYDQAVAKKAQDVATLANARIDLIRYVNLAKTNAGPQQQADQQVAMVAQLEAQVKADEAAIENAKAYLDYCIIFAPFEGRVGLRQVDPGNIVHAADTNGIVLLTQVRPITVVFTLPQRDLPTVSAALARGKAVVEVLDSNHGVLASGTLQTIDNQIDVTTGTIKLKALFANDDDKLWPGQFVSARVVVDRFIDAKVVPATALRRGPAGTFVYAVVDSRASVRPVEVLLEDEAHAVIGKGIDNGALVVTVGFAQLADKRPVEIIPGDQPVSAGRPESRTPETQAPETKAPAKVASDKEESKARARAHERHRKDKDQDHSHESRWTGATREAQQ